MPGSAGILPALALLAALAGCATSPPARVVSLHDLESAPAQVPQPTQRSIVPDPDALRPLYSPLGRRLGLIQIRDARQWQQLAVAVPQLGPCPDLRRGIVVGLVSPSGTCLDGRWPFHWDAVRVRDGAGLIEARFNGGNYLPDGTTYLETAHVEGLATVLLVNVDGLHYLPE